MDSARRTLQKIVMETLKRLPAEQVPLAAWEFASGRNVAEKTRAVTFHSGVLVVEVPDATWQGQLRSMTPHFLSMLNQYSAQKVDRIDFVLAKR